MSVRYIEFDFPELEIDWKNKKVNRWDGRIDIDIVFE